MNSIARKYFLIFLILFSCFIYMIIEIPSYAVNEVQEENYDTEDVSAESMRELTGEKDLNTLKTEKSELESKIEESTNQINFIEEELTKSVAEIAELNQKIVDMQMEIEVLTTEEKENEKYIENAEIELENSTKRYESQNALLEKRLVAMYEMGSTTYLDILLNSKGIANFLSNWYIISEIISADKELLQKVLAEKEYNQKISDNLAIKKSILSSSREKLEKQKISLSNMEVIKNSKINKLSLEELELNSAIEEYQNQVSSIETQIRTLAIANVGKEYVGGEMIWPVPGYTRITSEFGMRTHPITGVYKLHTGVDVGAPVGSNFVAVNDGVVTYAGYNTAYGNMVIVDHGGGVSTLYAHGSEILVSVGDVVFQGDSVLKVGSTGYSTGPHAHFEVRINGEYVNPLTFISSETKEDKIQVKNETVEFINTIDN